MDSMEKAYIKGDQPVPGYRLVKFLGKGGFGSVWRATGPGGIDVALKIIALDNKQGFKEFRAIRMVKNIHHPHLVPINGFWLKDSANSIFDDTAESDSFVLKGKATELIIAMGLGEKSLLDRLEDCRKAGGTGIESEELLGYMEGAARAIDFLNRPVHKAGSGPMSIQHCDIKPQNILIVGGEAQVCDFGLARVLGDPRATQSGGAMSLPYTPPEILSDTKPSQSSDQYALAVTYYELRTGELPFEDINNPGNLMWRIMQGKLDLSRLPAAEQEVMRRATASDPKQRFSTSLDMVRELRKIFDGVATTPSKPRPTAGHEASGQEIVPGYKLIKRLGQGGYGTVWEAQAPGGKPVAVKVIHNVEGVSGKQEFRALEMIKALEHEYLLELHAYWLKDKDGEVIPDEVRHNPEAPEACTLVIATRLAKQNLLQRLHECQKAGHTGIPASELLPYITEAADAIDFLNEPQHRIDDRTVSIQHRDIKPENILLVGRVAKVGDFGLAKVLEGTSALVHGHSAGFTPHYAAPELFNGQVSRWTDQYSLAITYYKLRTGRLPFDGTAALGELLSIHMEGRLDFSAVGNDEQEVLRRATALVPEDRYETCHQMAQHLAKAIATSEVSEQPLGPTIETITPMPAAATPRKTPMLASMPEPDALPGMIATAMPAPNPISEYGSTPTYGDTMQPVPAEAIAARQKAKADPERTKTPSPTSKPRTDPDRASGMPAAKGGWKDQGQKPSPSKAGIGLGLPVAIFVAILSAAGIGYGIVRHWPTKPASNTIAHGTGGGSNRDEVDNTKPTQRSTKPATGDFNVVLAEARAKLEREPAESLRIADSFRKSDASSLTEPQQAELQLITAQAYARLNKDEWKKLASQIAMAQLGRNSNTIAEVLRYLAQPASAPSQGAKLEDLLNSFVEFTKFEERHAEFGDLPHQWESAESKKRGDTLVAARKKAVSDVVHDAKKAFRQLPVALALAKEIGQYNRAEAEFPRVQAAAAYNSLVAAANGEPSKKVANPFADYWPDKDRAQNVYDWLKTAYEIRNDAQKEMALPQRKLLAVAAMAHKPAHPKLAADLLANWKPEGVADEFPFILAKARALREIGQDHWSSFQHYALAYQGIQKVPKTQVPSNLVLFEILDPQAAEGEAALAAKAPIERKSIAEVYLRQAQLIEDGRDALFLNTWRVERIRRLERAADHDPDPKSYLRLSRAHREYAIDLAPSNPDHRKNLESALKDIDEALNRKLANTRLVRFEQGRILMDLARGYGPKERFAEAARRLSEAVAGDGLEIKEWFEGLLLLSDAYRRQKPPDYGKALEALARGLDRAAQDASSDDHATFMAALKTLAKIPYVAGDLKTATKCYTALIDRARKAKDEDAEFLAADALFLIARKYLDETKDAKAALEVFDSGLPRDLKKIGPFSLRLLNWRTNLFLNEKNKPLLEKQKISSRNPFDDALRGVELAEELARVKPDWNKYTVMDRTAAYTNAAISCLLNNDKGKGRGFLDKAKALLNDPVKWKSDYQPLEENFK